MQRKVCFVGLIVWVVLASSCTKEDTPVSATAFTGFVKPANFPEPVYHFSTNPITQAQFELGKKLFYDPILSIDNTIGCGDCHIQTSAFTHHGHIFSHGVQGREGTRNAPPIMNLAWHPSFMWDGGIVDLDLQSIAPITNHVEMDERMPNVINKLKTSSTYPALFAKAFGSSEITGTMFLKAMSQFMLMCVSSHSKYDSVMRGEANVQFTAQEKQGLILVQQKCTSCHKEPLFTDFTLRNNGIGANYLDDKGRAMVTNKAEDNYKFKVPSLRNLSHTAPYMHDGRFLDLDAVLDHYATSVKDMPTLDPILKSEATLGISLSSEEKTQIKAFLKTLDDRHFLFDPLLAP